MDKCGDKAVGNPNNRYDSNECMAYDVGVRVKATVQTLKPVKRFINTYKVISYYNEQYYWNGESEPFGDNVVDKVQDATTGKWSWTERVEEYEYITTYENESGDTKISNDYGTYSPEDSIEYIAYYTDKDAETKETYVGTDTNDSGMYVAEVPLKKYKTMHGTYREYIKSFQVEFTYNGVEYITCESRTYRHPSCDSLQYNYASEIGRINFNKKFQTIKEITDKNLYDAYGSWNKANMKSEVAIGRNYPYSSGMVVDGSAKRGYYEMNANTGTCDTEFDMDSISQVINNVNIGLNYRYTDLALTMNVDKTKITINGKTTEYDYPDISINKNEELQNWLNSVLSDNKINVDAFKADYYYRIDDYIKTSDNSNFIVDENETKDLTNFSQDQELDIQVTYRVRMFEQVKNSDSAVKELIYYYDNTKYDFVGITSGSYSNIENNPNGNISGYESISGYGQIKVTGNWKTSGSDQELYFTFRAKKDANRAIIAAGNTINGNIVAITSYYTVDGLLDRDSSTRNIVGSNGEIQYEDDTARAEDVNVNLINESRTISGKVFDSSDNKTINDVIVQLIEIRNNSEYIWQETKVGTGDNYIRSVVRMQDGEYSAYDYENGAGAGEYKFINMVPGNYIVRFIYGDGYNRDITVNNTKYNGADYKSMADLEYRNEWLNDSLNSKGNSEKYPSVARDNEARRLSIMATMTEIDAGLGTALDIYANQKSDLTEIEKANILNYLNKLKDSNDNEFNAAINYLKTAKGNNDSWNTWRNNVLNNISDGDLLVIVKKLIAYKTFMVAETSKINVPVQTETLNIQEDTIKIKPIKNSIYKIVKYNYIDINFTNVNFGLMKKPEVKLELEKHITGLKITTNGTGTAPIVDASITNLEQIINESATQPKVTGVTTGLATDKSTRGNRGFWELQTDTEELKNGANLEVEYTYVVKNIGDEDYISSDLATLYTSNQGEYSSNLKKIVSDLKNNNDRKGKTYIYGNILGQYYYTGQKGEDVPVTTRAEEIAEALNNQLRYEESKTNSYINEYFAKNSTIEERYENIYDLEGNPSTEKRNTVIKTTNPSSFLATSTMDISKKVKLETVLSSLDLDSKGNIPSYIAEITKYSSASGGRDLSSIPGNLNYVHSQDTRITVEDNNEQDEFWGETIIITKPTGENKILAIQIGITALVSVAVIGVGIVLIRKIVLTK